MRRSCVRFVLLMLLLLPLWSASQNVNGIVVADTGNIRVIKVWGTHYQRGFACGYLCAASILDIFNGYILPQFGLYMPLAKQMITAGTHFRIDSVYFDEARGMLAGMDSAGVNTAGLSYLDILVANSYLDISAMAGLKSGMGCSSLMSWGSATAGTDLNGKAVISRHLDWTPNLSVTGNQVVVIHFPSEAGEQPWLLIGFAGQIAALSGVNNSGLGVFQHMMSDYSGATGQLNMAYEPVWFSLRRALEQNDINTDGISDVVDMQAAIQQSSAGYADGYLISMLSPGDSSARIAMVAETAPEMPFAVFRGSEFPDSIPGQNLYVANYQISRNDMYHFCGRYLRTRKGLGSGTNIGSLNNWAIMRDSSNSGNSNIQFMQYIPDDRILRLSVYRNGKAAYRNPPVEYNLDLLFMNEAGMHPEETASGMLRISPNPCSSELNVSFAGKCPPEAWEVYDLRGSRCLQSQGKRTLPSRFRVNTSALPHGIYVLKVYAAGIIFQCLFAVRH